ncbi:hypothetical protein FHT21_001044 [Pedobacter sp. SG908]|nr:hypothetical protein [Pedobacter sp. SG908]NMN36003.1 hypothetical protein [Pedobacter sp. SG918]
MNKLIELKSVDKTLKKLNLFELELNKILLKCDHPADPITIRSVERLFFKQLNYPKSPDKHLVPLRFYQLLLK